MVLLRTKLSCPASNSHFKVPGLLAIEVLNFVCTSCAN